MEFYFILENNDTLKFTGTWMELEETILNEAPQTQKAELAMYSLISGYYI